MTQNISLIESFIKRFSKDYIFFKIDIPNFDTPCAIVGGIGLGTGRLRTGLKNYC